MEVVLENDAQLSFLGDEGETGSLLSPFEDSWKACPVIDGNGNPWVLSDVWKSSGSSKADNAVSDTACEELARPSGPFAFCDMRVERRTFLCTRSSKQTFMKPVEVTAAMKQ